MADPYIGEIRLFGFRRIPTSWLACDGSLQSIAQFQVLYTVIGTTYGGDGATTFGLPDLRGRIALAQGTGGGLSPRVLGERAGEDTHTLSQAEMPSHSHGLMSTTNTGTTATPSPSVHLATTNIGTDVLYAPQANVTGYTVLASSVGPTGNNQPHDNMMPTLTCNYCICFEGIFPSPS